MASELETQGRISDDLLLSYREQFNIGRRSLLDVLDAQNTRYNVQQQAETARLAKLYAQYRVLAAENRLIECLGVQMPAGASAERNGALSGQSDPAGGPAGKQHSDAGHGTAAGSAVAGAPVGSRSGRGPPADTRHRRAGAAAEAMSEDGS